MEVLQDAITETEVLWAALTETEVLRAALTKAVLEETEVVGAEEQKQGRYDSSSSHHRLPTRGNMLRREGHSPEPLTIVGTALPQRSL